MAEEVPTYYAGQTIRGAIVFNSFGTMPIKEVTAHFGHDQDQDAVIELSDTNPQPIDGRWEVELSGYVDATDEPGLYRCFSVNVTYEGGRLVALLPRPNVGFRIELEHIPNPQALSKWRWLQG